MIVWPNQAAEQSRTRTFKIGLYYQGVDSVEAVGLEIEVEIP